MTGGEKVWLCVHDLKEVIKTLHYASKEDDKRDDDHDGIPDVKQVRCIRATLLFHVHELCFLSTRVCVDLKPFGFILSVLVVSFDVMIFFV